MPDRRSLAGAPDAGHQGNWRARSSIVNWRCLPLAGSVNWHSYDNPHRKSLPRNVIQPTLCQITSFSPLLKASVTVLFHAGQWSQLREEVVADLVPSAVVAGDRTVPGQVPQRVGCEALLGRLEGRRKRSTLSAPRRDSPTRRRIARPLVRPVVGRLIRSRVITGARVAPVDASSANPRTAPPQAPTSIPRRKSSNRLSATNTPCPE